MTESEIKQEAESFFEWPMDKRTDIVTLTSCLLFAKHCVEKANGWRPIEEAPKDGTEFDAWDSQQKDRVANVSWNKPDDKPKDYRAWCYIEYESNYGFCFYEARNLTHFMNKPQAPDAA